MYNKNAQHTIPQIAIIAIIDLPFFVWAEMDSASCWLASCSGRRSGGHPHHPCVPMGAMCRHLRLCMTGRIGLRHRDSRETDTSHTSESLGCSAIVIRNSPSKSALSSDGIAFSSERTSTTILAKTASVCLMRTCS